ATGKPPAAGGALTFTLPRQIDCFASARDNRAAYRVAVLRDALGAHDDQGLHGAVAVGSATWRRIHRWLERLRIDAALTRRYPGARTDLQRQRAHDLAARGPASRRRWPLLQALDALARHALGEPGHARDPALLALLRQAADALERSDAGPLDSARIPTPPCAAAGLPPGAPRAPQARGGGAARAPALRP